ncbi:Alpha/Beta hydrolase protein [Rhizoctonia solani]|nr:Alpha/Beta hydrolase protein [Rhizoctonia solani]
MWGLICTSIPSVLTRVAYRACKPAYICPKSILTKRNFSSSRIRMAPATISKYPEGTPFETGMLEVSQKPPHTLYYEVSGNKDGKPGMTTLYPLPLMKLKHITTDSCVPAWYVYICLYLPSFINRVASQGGPGGGVSPSDRTYFDPEKYKIVLFDQRGCGKSQPTSSLEANTTWDLVADIERLREKLGIDKWVVFGGSWGSTLSLAYAQTHPDRVKGLILRGIFTLRKSELDFFYQNGTSHLFPEAWEEYIAPVPEAERGDFVKAYHKLLNSDDEKIRLNAAKAWSKWEMTTSKLYVDPEYIAKATEDGWANAFARIENHYFINEGFMQQSIDKIRHIPTIVVQGRYDVVCPATTAWALKKEWPDIELQFVPDAGHSAREPATAKLLTEAADKFASL